MNSSAPRKTPPRRQADQPVTTPLPGKATCLVFLDDRMDFLDGIGHSAARSGGRYRIHTFHTGTQKNLPAFLLSLIEKGERPDALLIDLIIADSEEGQSGLDYLTALRQEPRLLGVPAVIATSAGDGSVAWDEDNYGRTQPGLATIDGADDYLLGKRAALDFLEECQRRLPFWRVQARSRLWQTLIRRLHGATSAHGSWEATSRAITRDAFAFLHQQLGVDHALLRMNNLLPGATLDIFERLHAEWADPQKNARPEDVPILQTILEARGKAVAENSLSATQVGAFKGDPQGMRLLGVALCQPGEEPFGVITLLREKAKKGYTKLDEFWVERLAGSLSAILGQSRHVQQLKDRQARALDFARHLDATGDEGGLCQQLAEFLHKEMHGEKHGQSKVTVRLIALGEPLLKRFGAAGTYCDSDDIPLDRNGEDNDNSVCSTVVNSHQSANIPDVTSAEWKDRYTDHYPGYPVRSELCIPIRAGAADEVHALGVVNLEHADLGYYRDHDMPFAETIVAYAAQALRQLRHKKLAESLLEWASEAHRLTAAQLWKKAADALFAYSGYGVLLHLAPPDGWPGDQGQHPWRVARVHVPVPRAGMTDAVTKWQGFVDDNWQSTMIRRSLAALQQDKTPLFTDNMGDFVQVGLLLGGARQRGNALVPLVTREGRFIGVLVLLWFHRPALDNEDKALLATFGRYCAELAAHHADWTSKENQLLLAEQRRVLANAAQQFEHVLANRLGGIGNALNEMRRTATDVLDSAQRTALMRNISVAQDRLDELDTRSRRAILYMRVPVMQAVTAEEIWTRVAADMSDKARRVGASLVTPGTITTCRADPEILYNILFILLDNALDAVKEQVAGRVWLQVDRHEDSVELTVADTGPGLLPEIREKLFVEEGISSKHTLGVALFLARQRARAMTGDLAERGSPSGARFVLTLATE
jgi:signal transduction histidine kinase/CheY-like chemotaxis protein